jgi:hypothetical protein
MMSAQESERQRDRERQRCHVHGRRPGARRAPGVEVGAGDEHSHNDEQRARVGRCQYPPRLMAGLEAVLLLTVAREILHTDSAGYGTLTAASGLGAVAGLAIAIAAGRSGSPGRFVLTAAASMAALAFAGPLAVTALVVGAGSSAAMAAEIGAIRRLQHSISRERSAAAFAGLDAVMVASMLAGVVIAPVFTGMLRGPVTLVIAGLGVAALVPGQHLAGALLGRRRSGVSATGDDRVPARGCTVSPVVHDRRCSDVQETKLQAGTAPSAVSASASSSKI